MNKIIASFLKEKFSILDKCKDWETGVNRYAAEHWNNTHLDRWILCSLYLKSNSWYSFFSCISHYYIAYTSCPCDVYLGSKFAISLQNVLTDDNWIPKLSRVPKKSVFESQASSYAPKYNHELSKED